MIIHDIGTALVNEQYRLFSALESTLSPLTDQEWENVTLRVALLAQKVIHASVLIVAEVLVGSLALVGIALQMMTAPKETGFPAIVKDSKLWENVDTNTAKFPEGFRWGAASCEYQQSGLENCPDSHWAKFEIENLPEDNRSRKGTDLWNRMDEHIAILKDLGLDTFRFSIEWSKIEREEGVFDEEAIQHYVTFAKKLNEAGIKPMACLLHFSMPQWVEDQGGILNPEFPELLTKFAEKVFPYLEDEVSLWNTINEPEIQAFMGYLLGKFPPKHHSMKEMGIGLKHLLQAHCAVYRAIKTDNVQIGLVHNVLRFKAYRWWHPMERLACHTLTKIVHESVRDFLRTGTYSFKVPFLANEFWQERDVRELNDFNGINCYGCPLIQQVFSSEVMKSTGYDGEEMTKMEFREDPAGLYEAILEMSDKPIYITENGISATSDEQMNRYYERALYAVSKAIEAGANVLGYCAWSAFRNSEWNWGWSPQNFGLYDCDRETGELTQRPGAEAYINAVRKHSTHMKQEIPTSSLRERLTSTGLDFFKWLQDNEFFIDEILPLLTG